MDTKNCKKLQKGTFNMSEWHTPGAARVKCNPLNLRIIKKNNEH